MQRSEEGFCPANSDLRTATASAISSSPESHFERLRVLSLLVKELRQAPSHLKIADTCGLATDDQSRNDQLLTDIIALSTQYFVHLNPVNSAK